MKYITATLLAMILANLIAAFASYVKPLIPYGQDLISVNLRRFAKLKNDLPEHSTVGYLADAEVTQLRSTASGTSSFLELSSYLRFVQTQYSIVPDFLVHTLEPKLVIGNFLRRNADSRQLAQEHLRPVKDYGDGVVLYEHY